jgi:4-amino-4-deoxy-L-arabinose transferase-like glycosyltransferase
MEHPRRLDYFLVGLFTLSLFGVVLAVGGPLTHHEGVLSQTTRSMLADHDWIVPHYGEGPWLERPPLPQWISCAVAEVLGTAEWVLRLGPAFSATITVLLTVWLAGGLFGRVHGILSGLILATMYNFTRYATLAEADMFLAPIVAGTLCAFARLEFGSTGPVRTGTGIDFLGRRSWHMLVFFALLGATNLAKGLVFGTVMALTPIGVFLLWNLSWLSVRRYVWLWGWLTFAGIALAWPAAVLWRYQDAGELWSYDLFGRLHGHYLEEPKWYYFAALPWVMLPWTIPAIVGLKMTWTTAWRNGDRREQLVWCWAWAPLLVFSLAQGKHHHYMIHFLAPWAILAAHGCIGLWRKVEATRPYWAIPLALAVALDCLIAIFGRRIAGPSWLWPSLLVAGPAVILGLWHFSRHPRPMTAAAGIFAILFALYGTGFSYKGVYLHRSLDETVFLNHVRECLPPKSEPMIYAGVESLDALRAQYYLGTPSHVLHNLSFIRDDRISGTDVYLVTRYKFVADVEQYGQAETVCQCREARREESPADRWTLFHVHLRSDLERRNAHVRISPMQAIYRAPGPELD